MPVGREVKKIWQLDWWRARIWLLSLHISAQGSKVKGLQSACIAILFDSFGAKNLDSQQEFGHIENGNPHSS